MKIEGVTVIASARQAALEAESHITAALGTLAHLRSQLSRVEEENRDLRIEAAKRQTEFYTEREFAAIVKVSESTVGRLRLGGRLKFTRVGNQVRYMSQHLLQFEEVLATRRAGNGRKRQPR